MGAPNNVRVTLIAWDFFQWVLDQCQWQNFFNISLTIDLSYVIEPALAITPSHQ